MRTLAAESIAAPVPSAGAPDVLARVVLPVDGVALPPHADGAAPDTPTRLLAPWTGAAHRLPPALPDLVAPATWERTLGATH